MEIFRFLRRHFNLLVSVCVRACVRVCVRVRACVWVCACVRACVCFDIIQICINKILKRAIRLQNKLMVKSDFAVCVTFLLYH